MNRFLCLIAAAALATSAKADGPAESFSKLVGNVAVGPVAKSDAVRVPYITWGGDTATFLANGGLKTGKASEFGKAGLNVDLVAGDDFVGQVKDYVSGKSPMLRGTMRMLGQASEVIAKDPRTKPVVILQISWSGGDHIVSRSEVKTLNDLKGKRIAVQQGGPHIGLLYDALKAADIKVSDVELVFVPDLTGPDGPADKFRSDKTVDACCVITPDLLGLTGGFDSVGSGAEGTVEGARTLVSTQNMSRSIADVYAVRKDWYDANKPWVEKFVAGWLKSSKRVVEMRDGFEKSQRFTPEYEGLLTQAQEIFGEDVLPTLDVDAHGLLLDCRFMGLPGQLAFFEQSGNLSGFEAKTADALTMATEWGYAGGRYGFEPSGLDYRSIAGKIGEAYKEPPKVVEAEGGMEFFGDDLDDGTIVSFTISFEPNQNDFSVDRYGAEFDRALQAASTFGGAAVVIRGHSDPTKTLVTMLKSGMKKGLIKRTGSGGNYRYFLQSGGQSVPLDASQTGEMVKLIESGAFEGGGESPSQTMQAARNLSQSRAEAVKRAITNYARDKGIAVNLTQLQPVGAGISDPVIPKPSNMAEARENMRVEFRIVKVNPEQLNESDFDF